MFTYKLLISYINTKIDINSAYERSSSLQQWVTERGGKEKMDMDQKFQEEIKAEVEKRLRAQSDIDLMQEKEVDSLKTIVLSNLLQGVAMSLLSFAMGGFDTMSTFSMIALVVAPLETAGEMIDLNRLSAIDYNNKLLQIGQAQLTALLLEESPLKKEDLFAQAKLVQIRYH